MARKKKRFSFYERYAAPIVVEGGIKAQTRSGEFGKSWWARRWIAVLGQFDLGARLSRGRTYARNGQVTEIVIGRGQVVASVQGSRPKPYKVMIRVTQLSPDDWQKMGSALTARTSFLARLTAGEMPDQIEDVFTDAGLSLFPKTQNDLQTECSCPDWSNPCKHTAAVYYLIGEVFDSNPFLIFEMRGLDRDGLMALLGGLPAIEQEEPALPPEPLPLEHHLFWGVPAEPLVFRTELPLIHAAFPKRLGHFPFWRGERLLQNVLEERYAVASRLGQGILNG